MKECDFVKAINSVKITPEAQEEILKKTMKFKNQKENVKMSKRKFAVIAAAAVLVLSITAFAANGVISKWCSSSSADAEYKSLPSYEQCEKDVGYAPVLINSFENGYKFKEGSVVNNNLKDDSDKSVEKFKSITFRYEKNEDEVLLSADKFNSEMEKVGEVISAADGTDLYYTCYTNKVVPADYELTKEDEAAIENGDLVFSYGASEVSVREVQGLTWEDDGIRYSLTQIGGKLTMDELVEMANEIIAE